MEITNICHLILLPKELIQIIASYLGITDIVSLSKTTKRFQEIVDANELKIDIMTSQYRIVKNINDNILSKSFFANLQKLVLFNSNTITKIPNLTILTNLVIVYDLSRNCSIDHSFEFESVKNLTKLKSLRLEVELIPDDFCFDTYFPSLEHFDIRTSDIKPKNLMGLTNLTSLDLNGCSKDLDLNDKKKLKILDIKCCRITNSSISALMNLESLSVNVRTSNTYVVNFSFPKLTQLVLLYPNCKSHIENFEVPNLKRLSIEGNMISAADLCKLTQLVDLTIDSNYTITNIDSKIATHIKKLSIFSNTSLTDLKSLTNLESLSLIQCDISNRGVYGLTKLTSLNSYYTHLRNISTLKNLKYLSSARFLLKSLPKKTQKKLKFTSCG